MKKLLLSFMSCFLLLSAMDSMAQAPQKFNYQGIARDAKGNPMAQQKMSLKISVLPTSDATAAEYEEIQTVNTNEFGLYTLQIGAGTAVTGEMKTVKWETGNKYIKVAIDPKGGSDFVDAGTSQLLSVPYAIYADKAGMAKTSGGGDRTGGVSSAAGHVAGDANYLTKFTGLNTIGKSQLYENGINIGIGTTAPAARLHLYSNVASAQQYLRMQNGSSLGRGQFVMYNDGALSYSTFSKYGTTYAGGYTGIATLYPYANLLAFGNNGLAANDGLGRFLISSGGNVGISIAKGGTSKLKFHADFVSENVGIGGNSAPVSRVHLNNTDGTSMDLRLTNNTTGHTATDGLTMTENGLNAGITNKENGKLSFGTNNTDRVTIDTVGNVGIGTITPKAKLDVNGTSFFSDSMIVGDKDAPKIIIGDYLAFEPEIQLLRGGGGNSMKIHTTTNGLTLFEASADDFVTNNTRFQIAGTGGGNYVAPGTDNVSQNGTTSLNWSSTNSYKFQTPNVLANRKIVLFESATPNDHQFSGLGISSSTMRYQVPGTSDFHIFYAGTSPTTSNELMRVQGDGGVGIGTAASAKERLYVRKTQLLADGVGQSTIYGYRTRDAQSDGTGYGQSTANSAIKGFNFWGDSYTYGVTGFSWNDYPRSGGILGANESGTYWGSLGYKSSASVGYGLYATSTSTGTGRMADNNLSGIGAGMRGDMMGGWVKGDVMGLVTSGEMFSAYNLGDAYTSGKNVELVETANGKKAAAYANTSIDSKIYSDGNAALVAGTVHVNFDANYLAMIAEGTNPTITLTPTGGWANLYVVSVDRTGFTVAEANAGTSNTSFNWIAIGKRVDGNSEVPAALVDGEFDNNMKGVMFNENVKEQNASPVYWNGKELKFSAIPQKERAPKVEPKHEANEAISTMKDMPLPVAPVYPAEKRMK